MKAKAFRVLSACFVLAALCGAAPLRAACSVSCTATVPPTASVGASVSFQSTATPCDCSGGTSYDWTFGDGADSTAANPSHSYGSAGTYNWQLTVTSESATCVKSGSIIIGSITPPAGTYSGSTSLGPPFSVTVNASSQITGWQLGFSGLCGSTGSVTVSGASCAITNGSFSCNTANCIPFSTQTSISGTFTSTYDVSGNATLKAMPGTTTCCTQTPTFTGSRSPGPLTASASPDISSGTEPLLVNFTGSAAGGTGPYSYHWDFGDCTTSASQNPSHSYAAGNWNAVLTVTDSTSATDDASVAITALQGPGITVTPTFGLTTSESGTDATFTVVLETAPAANVTIEIHPSDTTEALLSTDGITELTSVTLTFTSANWSTPQTVTVHGQNDNVDDGDIACTVVTSPTDSTDASYDNIDPDDVSATNNDNDTAAVQVSPTTVTVSETGTSDTFGISLATEPAGDVVIDIASMDTGEATVSPAQLTFTSANYATPQTVTVTGVDDALADGHQQTTITVTMNAAATADSIYDAIDPADVTATTHDNELFSVLTTNPAGGAIAAPRAGNIAATTNATVNAATVTQSTFVVQGDQTGRISGTYSATSEQFTLDPTALLKPGELIRATARSGIQNATAMSLVPHVWEFTAAAGAGTGAMMAHPFEPNFGGGSSVAVALGDLDGDGDLDAVVANGVNAADTVWLNDGTGVFAAHPTTPSFGSGESYGISLGDLDADGDLDVLLANHNGQPETVWRNDGSGNFSAHPTTPSFGAGESYDATLGDLDGDGDLDAVVANANSSNTVWLNDGSGNFSAHPTTPTFDPSDSYGVALGDLDGDGDLDAVIANGIGQPDTVWLNDGDGNFSAHPTTPSFDNSWSLDVALGDVDGDGDLDAVVANYNNPMKETVWLNDGDGDFSAHPTTPEFGITSWGVALGDLDGDGDLDAIVADSGAAYLNDGDGNFTAHAANGFSAGGGIDAALGDIDGDGDLDSVIAATANHPEPVSLNMRILVTPSQERVTTEVGGTSTFTIVLGKQPTSPVTVQIVSGDVSEGLVSDDGVTAVSSLQFDFTSADWSTARTITIHGQNDAFDDGNVAYTIDVELATSDPFYSGVIPLDVSVTNTDDDTAGVNVSETEVTVNEDGTTDTFTVVLTSSPSGEAVIDVTALDAGEAMITPEQLTFGMGDWNTPQTVIVTGINDSFEDGDQTTTIDITMNASTSDPAYSAIDPANVAVTTLDNDVFEIVSTNPAGNENAAPRNGDIEAMATEGVNATTVTQSTWRVQGDQTGRIAGTYGASSSLLQLDPTNDFKPGETIKFTATNAIQSSEAAVALPPYVWQFTAATAVATGAFAPHPTTPSFPSFGGAILPALGDLDGDGDLDVVFSTGNGTGETVWLNNGSGVFTQDAIYGEGDTYDVALGDLDHDGDLDFVCGNRLEVETVWINDGNANFTQHATTFNGDWTMDVSLGDIDGDGDLDLLLGGQDSTQSVWVNDGTGGFTAHPTTPTLSSGGMNAIPLGDLDGDGDLDAVMANQNGSEHVYLNDGAGNFSMSSSFGSGNSFDVALGDVDGDGDLDAVVANMLGQAETVWANSGTGTFTSLSSFGDGDSRGVTLGDLDGDGDLDAAVANVGTTAETIWLNNGSGTFSAHPSVPTINAGTETWGLAFGDLDGEGDLDVLVANAGNPHQDETVWLNERIVVSPNSGLSTTEAGGTSTFTVVLGAAPAANVTVDVSTSDATEALVSSDGVMQQAGFTLTFTTSNWFTPQTVTLHGQNDAIEDGNVAYTIVTAAAVSSDPAYSGVSVFDVSATNTDNDTAGVNVSETDVTVAESGTTATFTVVLTSEPTGDVVIDVASLDTGEATVSPSPLTFTNANWTTPQTVTVTGVNDALDDGNQNSTIALTMNTGATVDVTYDAINPNDVTATTTDDDTAGVTVTESDSTTIVTEAGSTDTFTVVLTSEPTGDVVIDVASLDTGEATVSPSPLTFTSADWATPQTVTVTGVNDAIDDGNQNSTVALTMNVGATVDATYAAIDPNDVTASTTDDDTAGVNVSTSAVTVAETGTNATFTVVLTSEPLGDVVIDVSSSNPAEATAAPSQVTFTNANWATPQTVTVTGVDDAVDDGNQNSTITVTMNAGATLDATYAAIDPNDVTATTTDDDTAGVIVTQSDGTTIVTEAGSTDTFTAVLTSEPTGDVVIDVASLDTGEATVSSSQLTFSNANWATPQTVTITGVNDAIDDGNQNSTVALTMNVGATVDATYDAIDPNDVTATTTDDDTAGVNVSTSAVTVAETGTNATFTVVLTSEPLGDVVIDLSSSNPAEATVAPSQLTFTNANWATPQTVTVTGVNDAVDDGNQNSTIALTMNAGATADALYDAVDPADVTATTTDNDTAGVTVVQSGGTTSVTEGGSSDTFVVALTSEPAGDVVIDIASADTGEATVSPAQLTFTSANWMTAQPVIVTGVDDALDDGNQNTNIALTMNAGATLDAVYDAINPPDVTATTVDDDKTATTTALISSPNPSVSAQSVTFTATVSGGTGDVTFLDGATPMALVALSSGSASFSTTALSVGSHSITASYSGDTNFAASTSNIVNQVVNAAAFGPPPFVIASPLSTSSVNVTWSTVSGATSYEIFRTTSTAIAYALVGTTPATTLTDGSLSANTTYLYKVRAVNGGGPSALSVVDAATTTMFTDPTLTPGIRAKAAHMTELRTAVNAMRAAAALSAFPFTDPAITVNTTKWKAVHVTELRSALDAARAAIGLPVITWTDPTLTAGTTRIKAVHITQVRSAVH